MWVRLIFIPHVDHIHRASISGNDFDCFHVRGGDLALLCGWDFSSASSRWCPYSCWGHHPHCLVRGRGGQCGQVGVSDTEAERSWLTRRHRSVSSAFMKRNIRFIVIIIMIEMEMRWCFWARRSFLVSQNHPFLSSSQKREGSAIWKNPKRSHSFIRVSLKVLI